MEPQPEPAGDYGYDEVHADVRRPARAPEPPSEPQQRRAPAERSPGLGSDHGYDEAHSF